MKVRTVVFGAGGVGEECRRLLESQGHEIAGFADNNEKKWGSLKDGLPIYPPHRLPALSVDYIAIGVFKAVESIRKQLKGMGIPQDRIIVPVEPDRVFVNNRYRDDSGIASPESEVYSETTRAFLRNRRQLNDEVFLARLESLKQCLAMYNIPLAEVCVVSGGVLQAYGLRMSKRYDDVDIIMTDRFREMYGRGLVIVSEDAEMHPQNTYEIDDDMIVRGGNFHFVWCGLKFMRLSLLYDHVKVHVSKEADTIEALLARTKDPV